MRGRVNSERREVKRDAMEGKQREKRGKTRCEGGAKLWPWWGGKHYDIFVFLISLIPDFKWERGEEEWEKRGSGGKKIIINNNNLAILNFCPLLFVHFIFFLFFLHFFFFIFHLLAKLPTFFLALEIKFNSYFTLVVE